MLKSEKLFGRRESVADVKAVPVSDRSANDKSSGGLSVASSTGGARETTPSPLGPRMVPASIATPPGALAAPVAVAGSDVRSKLTVGPNIKLKGVEITDCDTLVVEGRVEATIDSRVIQISENGAFIGSAEFDIAEIRGDFDGDLTVRQKLIVYASGRVSGKVRYSKLVIEEGGQLSGDVQMASPPVKGLAVALG
jgi:cytoskeletal protein CcmA (bactofilin family)